MKVCDRPVVRQGINLGFVASRVQAALNIGQSPAIVFHHVNLTAAGPVDGGDVGPEQPEPGPEADTARQLRAPFKASILPGKQSLRLQPRRGVVVSGVRFLLGDDVKQAAGNVGVVGPAGVILQFAVAPAAAPVPNVVGPDVGVQVCAVEFIAPDNVPVAIGRAAGWDQIQIIKIDGAGGIIRVALKLNLIADEISSRRRDQLGCGVGYGVGVRVVLVGDRQINPGVDREGSAGQGIGGDESRAIERQNIRIRIPKSNFNPRDVLSRQFVAGTSVSPAVCRISRARAGDIILINAGIIHLAVERLIDLEIIGAAVGVGRAGFTVGISAILSPAQDGVSLAEGIGFKSGIGQNVAGQRRRDREGQTGHHHAGLPKFYFHG